MTDRRRRAALVVARRRVGPGEPHVVDAHLLGPAALRAVPVERDVAAGAVPCRLVGCRVEPGETDRVVGDRRRRSGVARTRPCAGRGGQVRGGDAPCQYGRVIVGDDDDVDVIPRRIRRRRAPRGSDRDGERVHRDEVGRRVVDVPSVPVVRRRVRRDEGVRRVAVIAEVAGDVVPIRPGEGRDRAVRRVKADRRERRHLAGHSALRAELARPRPVATVDGDELANGRSDELEVDGIPVYRGP